MVEKDISQYVKFQNCIIYEKEYFMKIKTQYEKKGFTFVYN